ncbi:hypothetical protein CVT24_011993 [Panaeolus cyanescens]|uniref:Uncharacterized protein n=1 Tax=Panaeolus cyanescens TaxID=181874 RepID=A0A409VHT5_9AGAR|nr:hypothetical protein CVT24_011993 [Panaeolus cyanescens]
MSQARPRLSLLSLFDPLSEDDTDKENSNAGEASFFHRNSNSQEIMRPAFKSRLIDFGDMSMNEPESNMLTDEEELEKELNTNTIYDDDNDTLTFLEMVKAATPKHSAARRAATMTTPRSSPSVRPPLSEIHLVEETTPIMRKRPYKRQITTPNSKLSQIQVLARQQDSPQLPSIPSTPTTFSPPAIIISPEETTSAQPSLTTNLGSSVCTIDLPPTSDALLTDTPAPILISPPSPHGSLNHSLSLISPSEHRLRPNSSSIASHHHNRVSVDLQASFNLQLGSSESSFDLLNDKISFLSDNNGLESFLSNLEDDASMGDSEFKSLDLTDNAKFKTGLSSTAEGCSQLKMSAEPSHPNDAPTESSQKANDRIVSPELRVDENVNEHDEHLSPESKVVEGNAAAFAETTSSGSGSVILSTPNLSRATQNPPRPVPALKIVKRSKPPSLTSRASLSAPGVIVKPGSGPSSRGVSRLSPPQTPSIVEDSTKVAQRGKAAILTSTVTSATSVAGPRRVLMKDESKLDAGRNAKPSSSAGGPRRVIVGVATDISDKGPVSKTTAQNISSGLRQPSKYATIGSSTSIPKPVVRPAASKLPAPAATTRKFGIPTSTGLGSRGPRI